MEKLFDVIATTTRLHLETFEASNSLIIFVFVLESVTTGQVNYLTLQGKSL